jgi:hypothetical protein
MLENKDLPCPLSHSKPLVALDVKAPLVGKTDHRFAGWFITTADDSGAARTKIMVCLSLIFFPHLSFLVGPEA